MIKIYGNPMSTCTRKVLMTCAETNTPFELSVVDFGKGEHKGAEHMTHQPFGQVPALDDDGFEMYESRAIARYINEKSGGDLHGGDLQSRATVEQWMSVETSNFSSHIMKFVYQYVFQRPQDPAVLDAATKSLDLCLSIMAKQLAAHPYLAGDKLTLADIGFMPYLEYAMNTPFKDVAGKYQHVVAWWNKISERPTWKKVAGRA